MTDVQLVRLLYMLCILQGWSPDDARKMANEATTHPIDSVTGQLAEPADPIEEA